MIPQEKLQEIINVLIKKIDPYVIILFGSAAQDRLRSDSDLDLAYLSDISLGNYERFLLSQELANLLNNNVDLIDLNIASTVFQAEIIHNGKVIHCSDDERRLNFEIKILKMYAKLNEERKEILDHIKKRGSIYE
ncbi:MULTISPECIES: nucleotidyltransferase domain-containing protein [unclassified Bacillus (in: firmicutes)]|uniref:type VII toxin-antitoxin system MntA family adenylyltransferase antitoxin n=1 Tax=unclassified Bacillus (in: firmicutes) TaxID=185979 RepID=UPI000BF17012|nr:MULTISPECIES: nucleotidyltransferase domain-containing protein [unclassified Bacillus (in: firmicutes)]PEJ50765.1 DNA polymerase subunit beta [Bacillus sp. AFS002410]PEL07351.1 DNA polymerase subunit beta [Bacillus sp. AFS017336]